jgi:hypothetical protein
MGGEIRGFSGAVIEEREIKSGTLTLLGGFMGASPVLMVTRESSGFGGLDFMATRESIWLLPTGGGAE